MFKVFSLTYWLLLFLIIPIYIFGYYLRNNKVLIYKLSFSLFLLEIFKQIYLLINNMWSVWFIPYQLCSMPMYLWIFKKTSLNNSYLSFISTYSLLSGIVALAYPMDMISHGLVLCIHSYIWHYIIILMASLSYFSKLGDNSFKGFLDSTFLFLGMVLIATIINLLFNSYGEVNMFYINPLRHSYQPIVKDLEKITNIFIANGTYLFVIIVVSYLINILLYSFRHNKKLH